MNNLQTSVRNYICNRCGHCLLLSGDLVVHTVHYDNAKWKMDSILKDVGSTMLAWCKRHLASMLDDFNRHITQLDLALASSVPIPYLSAPPPPSDPLTSLVSPVPTPASLPDPCSISPPPPVPSLPPLIATQPWWENMHLPERYQDNGAPPWWLKARKHADVLPEPFTLTTSDLKLSCPIVSSPCSRGKTEVQEQSVRVIPA